MSVLEGMTLGYPQAFVVCGGCGRLTSTGLCGCERPAPRVVAVGALPYPEGDNMSVTKHLDRERTGIVALERIESYLRVHEFAQFVHKYERVDEYRVRHVTDGSCALCFWIGVVRQALDAYYALIRDDVAARTAAEGEERT